MNQYHIINDNLRYKDMVVEGIKVRIIDFNGAFVLQVPLGKSKKEREMLDEFVYHNQVSYHSDSEAKLIKNFKRYIKEWKQFKEVE